MLKASHNAADDGLPAYSNWPVTRRCCFLHDRRGPGGRTIYTQRRRPEFEKFRTPVTQRRLLPSGCGCVRPSAGCRCGVMPDPDHTDGEFAPFDDYDVEADARVRRWPRPEQADGAGSQAVRDRIEVNAIIPPWCNGAGCGDGCRRTGAARSRSRSVILQGNGAGGGCAEALPDAVLRRRTVRPGRPCRRRHIWPNGPVRSRVRRTAGPHAGNRCGTVGSTDVPLAADELIRIDGLMRWRRWADVAILRRGTARRQWRPSTPVDWLLATSIGLCLASCSDASSVRFADDCWPGCFEG